MEVQSRGGYISPGSTGTEIGLRGRTPLVVASYWPRTPLAMECIILYAFHGSASSSRRYQGFALAPNWGTSVSQIPWHHTITKGPCPRQWDRNHRHGGVPPLLQIAGHVGQRGATRNSPKCTTRYESAGQN